MELLVYGNINIGQGCNFETQSLLIHHNSHKRSPSPCLQMTCAID